ncbi:MAG: chemotaxis protein CheW [Methylococcales bacterium]
MSEVIEPNVDSSNLIADFPAINTDVKSLVDLNLRYGIKLGGYSLLVPESIESEIIASPDIFPMPNTTNLMIGLISVRGRFAPVFDLGEMLNLKLKGRQTSIIVLQLNGDFLAFPYDSAHSLELPTSVTDNHPVLPDILTQFTGDIYQIGEEFWIEFDFKRCLQQFANQISQ